MYCFQICIPGLHISLGLFLKFFDMMKDECEELDIKVAKHKAETANAEGELLTATEFDTYVQTVRDAREHERVAKSNRQSAQQVQEYVAQQITVHDQDLTEDNPNPFLVQLLGYAAEMVKKVEEEV